MVNFSRDKRDSDGNEVVFTHTESDFKLQEVGQSVALRTELEQIRNEHGSIDIAYFNLIRRAFPWRTKITTDLIKAIF